jgi:hypothetical protein
MACRAEACRADRLTAAPGAPCAPLDRLAGEWEEYGTDSEYEDEGEAERGARQAPPQAPPPPPAAPAVPRPGAGIKIKVRRCRCRCCRVS